MNDNPPNKLQPRLSNGIHLRWSFKREVGFPWYGYYLFRRRHRPKDVICLREAFRKMKLIPGFLGTKTLNTPRGVLISDQNLVLRDDFSPPNIVELDLANRSYLRLVLPPDEPAHQARVTIGFRSATDVGTIRECVDLSILDDEKIGNPFTFKDVIFEVLNQQGDLWHNEVIAEIEGYRGLNVGYKTLIKLPCPASQVSLSMLSFADPATVVALDEDGKTVATAAMSNKADTLILEGKDIVQLRVSAPQNESLILQVCFVCTKGGKETKIIIHALVAGVPVVTKAVKGLPGQVVTESLSFDTITAIQFSGGPAAVIDICVAPVEWESLRGWEILPDFPYPLCLPVEHGDYPCTTKPVSYTKAEDMAVGRVRYGDPSDWRGEPFRDLHDQLKILVAGGPPPPGTPMADRAKSYFGVGPNPPKMPKQYPLDMIMIGSLNPAIAQMVGLYWVDKKADPAIAYDYMIVADHLGKLGGDAKKALKWLNSNPDFRLVDAYIVFNKRVCPPPPLDPPKDLRVYALPGSTILSKDGTLVDASNNAGLHWNLGYVMGVLQPDKPIMYHLWRADLGSTEPTSASPPSANKFEVVTEKEPILVVEPKLPAGITPKYPEGWPQFMLHAIDRGLPEGWYSYEVSGIDIFGRHSQTSDPARWFQWAPPPTTRPWYYKDPPSNSQVHPYAVGLLDKIAPPPPTDIVAYTQDPQDLTLLRDTAYNTWQESLTAGEKDTVIGLRVSWKWTRRHMQQAPDAKEFRIYYQPGQLNTLFGKIISVTATSSTESLISTDISNSYPADKYIGTWLRVGADAFRVIGSQAGTPLRLQVTNIGPQDDQRPPTNVPCSVVIPEDHDLFVDYHTPTNWQDRYHVVAFNSVPETTDANGYPLRQYEIFLPATGGSSLPLSPSLQEPIVYAHIGVTTADDKMHTNDASKWSAGGWGGRSGNEGRVGGPIMIYRVRREHPLAPLPPPDSECVFATPADYHGRSYYTYRWQFSPYLKTHVFRALDDAVFKADWKYRESKLSDPDPPIIAASDEDLFPEELRGNDPSIVGRRDEIAVEINQTNNFSHDENGTQQAMAHYRGLSNDALRVLASLSWTESAFSQITLRPLDPDDPELANRPGPDNPSDFPIDSNLRIYIDPLDGRSTNRYFYRSVYVDGAFNRSDHLSLSSPPVYLHNVVPPRAPVITKVLGGDRQITIKWASNRERDIVEYLVYRTDSKEASRDLRLMTLVHTEPVPSSDPAARPAELTWIDSPVPGAFTFYYRMVAVDDAGNVSKPSLSIAARAFDETLPVPPPLIVEWGLMDGRTCVHATWTSTNEALLQRRRDNSSLWTTLEDWYPPGTHTVTDEDVDSTQCYLYRLRVRKATGATAIGSAVILASIS